MDIETKIEEKNDLRSLQMAAIKEKLIEFTHSTHISASSNLQEEQERELAPKSKKSAACTGRHEESALTQFAPPPSSFRPHR